MAELKDRKLFLGPRLRMLRRELGLSQTRMAEEIGISASYLNHLERNQRPVTAQMLLRLASTYDVDMRDFVAGSRDAAITGLTEVFSDPLAHDAGVTRDEVIDIAENYPAVAEVLVRFQRALADLRGEPDLIERLRDGATSAPLDWLRDYLQGQHNHFPALDDAMEALVADLPTDPADLYIALRRRLEERHNISVRIVPANLIDGALRHYDLHRRRLMLSELLPEESRRFALARQIAGIEGEPHIAALVEKAGGLPPENKRLLRLALVNYAAAALVMPYGRIVTAARESRHDLPLLTARFGVSIEQLCHRLATLGRAGDRGVPFFMLKVDRAGNVAKRFAGDVFPFAMLGGVCPRWDLFAALRSPGRLRCQMVELPDGKRYVTLAFAFVAPGGGSFLPVAVALGCEIRHAGQIVHADGIAPDAATPIGPACHLCERPACSDRVAPPANRSLDLNLYRRDMTAYPFRTVK